MITLIAIYLIGYIFCVAIISLYYFMNAGYAPLFEKIKWGVICLIISLFWPWWFFQLLLNMWEERRR